MKLLFGGHFKLFLENLPQTTESRMIKLYPFEKIKNLVYLDELIKSKTLRIVFNMLHAVYIFQNF